MFMKCGFRIEAKLAKEHFHKERLGDDFRMAIFL